MKDDTNNAGTETPASSPTIDLAGIRLSQDFAAQVGVKKLLTTVPVRRPGNQDWIRVRPGEDYRLSTCVLEVKGENETYLVARELWPALAGELTPKVLRLAINRQGVVSLWPIRLPGEDGRLDDWNTSAHEAASRAESEWVRVNSNRTLGAYEVSVPEGTLAEPAWPGASFEEILEIAFKGRYIRDLNHPVVNRLRGR